VPAASDPLAIVFATLGALGGAGGVYGFIRIRAETRKLNSEAGSISQDASAKAVAMMQDVMASADSYMQRRLGDITHELEGCRRGLDECTKDRRELSTRLDAAHEALQVAYTRISALESVIQPRGSARGTGERPLG
jgi:uncharacterized protein HemX